MADDAYVPDVRDLMHDVCLAWSLKHVLLPQCASSRVLRELEVFTRLQQSQLLAIEFSSPEDTRIVANANEAALALTTLTTTQSLTLRASQHRRITLDEPDCRAVRALSSALRGGFPRHAAICWMHRSKLEPITYRQTTPDSAATNVWHAGEGLIESWHGAFREASHLFCQALSSRITISP